MGQQRRAMYPLKTKVIVWSILAAIIAGAVWSVWSAVAEGETTWLIITVMVVALAVWMMARDAGEVAP